MSRLLIAIFAAPVIAILVIILIFQQAVDKIYNLAKRLVRWITKKI